MPKEARSGNPYLIRSPARLIACLLVCNAVGILGSLVTVTGQGSWYASLVKPPFNPPSWVFAPAWTVLYILMAVSLYLIWMEGPDRRSVRVAMTAFAVQLFLNGIWSPLFFGLQSPLLGLVDILALWVAVAVTIRFTWPLNKDAAYLLVPYILWISFASLLNGAILVLNP